MAIVTRTSTDMTEILLTSESFVRSVTNVSDNLAGK